MDTAKTTINLIGILCLIAGLAFPVAAMLIPAQLGSPSVVTVAAVGLGGVLQWAVLTLFGSIAQNLEEIRLNTALTQARLLDRE